MPQNIHQTEFQEMLAKIKAQSDAVRAERPITETDIASIVTTMLSGSGMADLDNTETLMFYDILFT